MTTGWARGAAALLACALSACGAEDGGGGAPAGATETTKAHGGEPDREREGDERRARCERTIKADVVALDQSYTYNRFGAFNPAGMLYALERDVVAIDGETPGPGNATLREDKRPRPIVLRMNVGDCLEVDFTNWLARDRDGIPRAPDVPFHAEDPADGRDDSPFTRKASFHVNGLHPLDVDDDGSNVGRNDSSLVAPGASRKYRFFADREGTFFVHSMGAISGGEGDGGQLVQGLFGAVNVEPEGSVWYRSQVTAAQLEAATKGKNPDGTPRIDFDAEDDGGTPILRMLDDDLELVHSDLTAIVAGYRKTEVGTPTSEDQGAFRETTILFHDELQAVQAFPELTARRDLAVIGDIHGINYGSGALGPILLANRKRLGPAADCVECLFEEFFLTSWANGDPALNVEVDAAGVAQEALWPDDPSNVYHSYVGDPMRIRNIHAGPAETHIFHLHSHQWLFSPGNDESSYLDSQSIGPGSAYTYDINFGGSGNRNLTPGDAIFHCHLYPHFAAGMWGLWRLHDVFENGKPDRNLPDGEIADGTPTPAIVPLPGFAMPPVPTWSDTEVEDEHGRMVEREAMPGYPFYLAALAGHRPPQPPLDLEHDGGLPRHLVTSVEDATLGRRGEFDVELEEANLKLLPNDGTPAEKDAIAFHAGRFPGGEPIETVYGFPAAAYDAFTPEGRRAKFVVNGQDAAPGAPYADPCPPDAPERHYRVAYVETDLVANRAGWHDPQGRIIVLEEDVEETLCGTRRPEPLVMRARSGECVVLHATNLIRNFLAEDDFQIFTPTDTLGQHIHLVKFDVTSSDGSANGFNYEDGTFSADTVRERIAAANALGGAFAADGTLEEAGRRKLLAPEAHPRIPSAPLGAQTTVQRWWADPIVNERGEDRTMTNVFTHDHFAPSSQQQHGFYAALSVEPSDSIWRDPKTGAQLGTRDDGGPTSTVADIITGPNGKDSYREFQVALADFALLYDAAGNPVNPPTAQEAPLPIAIDHPDGVRLPEAISARDPGGMVVNYRNEPIPLRIGMPTSTSGTGPGSFVQKPGDAGAMENVFRTDLHGDPFTDIFRAYAGDRVQIRMMEGAQEEMHAFSVHGVKWLKERADADSGYTNNQSIGISEHFEFEFVLPPVAMDRDVADYMYKSTPVDDLWNGTWGLLRSFREQQRDLKPLPNNRRFAELEDLPSCPPQAKKRDYTVHAVTARGNVPGDRLVYNEKFDLYDPDGILYVLDEHLEQVRAGTRRPETLVLRAAAGECVRVTLVNELPEVLQKTPHWNIVPPIIDGFNVNQVAISNHVGLHPHLVHFDVTTDDGVNVGRNPLQTVPPGQRRTYEWYAGSFTADRVPFDLDGSDDEDVIADDGRRTMRRFKATPIELGAVNLRSMADVVNHGTHGAIGTLVIEPKGATWEIDPDLHAQATVRYRDHEGEERSFRELVIAYQDEIALHSDDGTFQCEDASLNCGTALRPYAGADDAEDSGGKGFNHRTEPLWARLGVKPELARVRFNDLDLSDVLSSAVHGDPETPIFTARAGQDLRLRVLVPSGHARQHAFTLHGAQWLANPFRSGSRSTEFGFNEETFAIGTQGAIAPSGVVNAVPRYGAGGPFEAEGDFLYRDQPSFLFPAGLWGILRIGDDGGGTATD